MRVVLILSLALVVLASVSFAAPSRVILPAYAPEEISKRGTEIYESFLEWRRSLPADSDRSFLAYQDFIEQRELPAGQEGGPETYLGKKEQDTDIGLNSYRAVEVPTDDGDQPQIVPLVSAFGYSAAELQGLYQEWLPKVPEGEDSSFQAFLDWMKLQEETEEQEESEEQVEPEDTNETDQVGRVTRWSRKINDWIGSNDKREDVAEQQPSAEVQGSVEEEQPEVNLQKVATEFGLSEDELEELYRLWLSKIPTGEDDSFQAFVGWMNEHNDPEVDEDGTPRKGTYIRWGWKIADWYRKADKQDTGIEDDTLTREVQQYVNEEQPQINRREVATGNEDAELAGENVERQLQEAIATAYEDQNDVGYESQLRDTERREGEEPEGQSPVPFVEEKSQETPAPVEEVEPKEDQTPLPFVETEPNDTNGGYSCEENSPCNIENIANEQFYFATASSDKFIQCDAWGGCHTLTCDDGLVWDDQIKTCGIRT